MLLPAWTDPDEGYPVRVGSVDGAKKVHILVSSWRAACGVVTQGAIESLGPKRRPVCSACRQKLLEVES